MAHLRLIALALLVVVAVNAAVDPNHCPIDEGFIDKQCTGSEEEGLECSSGPGSTSLPICSCKSPHQCTKVKLEGGGCKFTCKSPAYQEAVMDELKSFDMGVPIDKKKK